MLSISEAIKCHPTGVQPRPPFDLEEVPEVPESHAWPEMQDHLAGGEDNRASSVPVIDLADSEAVDSMGRAGETWGVFQIINHGIPATVLAAVELQGRRLFALPAQQKLRAARAPDGLVGYGVARISSFFSKQLWSEGFTIVGSAEAQARLLWPDTYSQFCEVMEAYEKAMQKLAERLLRLLLASLGINEEETWSNRKAPASALQLNWYPPCPNPDRAMGLGEHTDSPLLTILYQNGISGLQVLGGDGRWETVPPLPGALVVNVGDLLHILSNGRFRSVVHRAVVNRTRHRLSVAYFWAPPNHVTISPLERLVRPDSPALYPPVSWPEYLKIRAQHFTDSLSVLRRQAASSADSQTARRSGGGSGGNNTGINGIEAC